jgi:hypothetical protein
MGGRSKLPLLTVLGGAITVAGSVMPFAKFSFEGFGVSQAETVSGLDTDDGKIYLAFGIGLIVLGLISWTVSSVGARRAIAVLAVLASLFLLVGAFIDIQDIESQAGLDDALAEQGGGSIEELEALGLTFDTSTGLGLYAVAVGGLVGLIGAIASVISRGQRTAVVVAPGAVAPPTQTYTPATAPPPVQPTAPPTTTTPPATTPPPAAPPPPSGTPPPNP